MPRKSSRRKIKPAISENIIKLETDIKIEPECNDSIVKIECHDESYAVNIKTIEEVKVERKAKKFIVITKESDDDHVKKEPEENFEFYHPSDEEKKTEKPRLNCKLCSKTFKTKLTLKNHQKTHNHPIMQCNKCKKIFKQRGFFIRHNCNTICSICDTDLLTMQVYHAHMRTIHTKELNITWMYCDKCGLKFSKKFRLILHMNTKHINAKVKNFICDFDGKIFVNKDRLYRHMTSHLDNIECQICYKKIKPRTIWSHMKKTHETEFKFSCDICQKKFKSKELKRHHMMTHNKKFKCNICHRRFAVKHMLAHHMFNHENPRSIKCEICNKGFNYRSNLKNHMKIHQEVRLKPYKCSRCDYSSSKKDHLRYHMNSHKRLDEKYKSLKNAVKCEKCPSMCKNMTLLKMHMKYVHPVVQFQCDLCGRFIKMKSNVKHHLRKFHKLKIL